MDAEIDCVGCGHGWAMQKPAFGWNEKGRRHNEYHETSSSDACSGSYGKENAIRCQQIYSYL